MITVVQVVMLMLSRQAFLVNCGVVVSARTLPNPPAAIFNKTAALEMLFYAEMNSCNPGVIYNWTCAWCKPPAKPLEDIQELDDATQKTHGYVARIRGSQTILVGFQGSENVQNWIDNLDFKKTVTTLKGAPPQVRVHAGFQIAYNSLRKQMFTALSLLLAKPPCNYQGCAIHVIGHSLGGALATFAALDIKLQGNVSTTSLRNSSSSTSVRSGRPHSSIDLTTFGSPRVGNIDFTKWASTLLGQATNSVRLVNQNDAIPGLPPRQFGFHHIPVEVFEKKSTVKGEPDTYYVCNNSGEDPICEKRSANSIADHMHYMEQSLGSC
jgi:pimeloyl-ACP methyl ester carboxylesterase